MKGRDYIKEILLKKERAKYNERDYILSYRFSALDSVVQHCYKTIDSENSLSNIEINPSDLKNTNELHKYIPIGIIACLESYFRSVIKELIDFGSPFSDKAIKLREIKFDFTIVQAIEGKKVTVGDFLSHLIPMKSFEDANSTIGTLTGKDFLHEIKPYFFENEDDDNERFPSIDELTDEMHSSVGKIYDGVKETFKLRNIFCHEAAEPEIVDVQSIYKGYISTKKFLEATNEYIWELIEPNRPQSNYEWSLKLDSDLNESKKELENLIKQILKPSMQLKDEFQEVQSAWENYIESRMSYIGEEWGGGSGTGIAMLSEEIYYTEKRIKELKEEISDGRYNFEDEDFLS